MEYFNKILCVTYAELTGGNDAVISGGTLLKNVTRGNIASVHRGGGEGRQASIFRVKFREPNPSF